MRRLLLAVAALLSVGTAMAAPPSNGLVTVESHHSAIETIARFEDALRAHGWTVFTVIDHAAAAKAVGLELAPRSVVVFGQPQRGTDPMRSNPTLAIDLPLKALVWQDDKGKVWLTYNSAEYLASRIYGRHGITIPHDAQAGMRQGFAEIARQATD